MGEAIIDKHVENGVVWVRAQVDGRNYDLGVLCDEHWHLRLLTTRRGFGDTAARGFFRAKQLACAWAEAHPNELEALFREAAQQRESLSRMKVAPESEVH